MSSSQPFLDSSALSASDTRRRKSKFTFKDLAHLSRSSTTCPLRVVAHVDLDAFYAQCELVRLGLAEDQPLAVRQWQGLIAVNYPAREFGLSRHIDIVEAKKLCPNLIMQHVATWREGDEKWAYHDDAFNNIATHKVSLDPYRLESRRILACIKENLPANLQKVEKAGIDEVFMDLSAQTHFLLLERYPELAGPAPYDDPTENLPLPPIMTLDWQADALVDLDANETEDDDPDWDDMVMLIGSEIVRTVRAAVREKLKYTCSAGIARNKMLAKLGSAFKKPNQQTIIRNRAVQHFLSDFKFTKIRNLGGKLGESLVTTFKTDTVKDLLLISPEQLRGKFGDDTGTWIYQAIRGIDTSEVNARTEIKSMLSAKSFRPSINTPEQATRWLRIFAADIYSRLVEEGVLENKRRPKTITLHHRSGGQTRSRQLPIPQGKRIDEAVLIGLSRTLLGQIVLEGRVWPCANISLSVGGFEDGVAGNMSIGAFLVNSKGFEAEALSTRGTDPSMAGDREEKRRRLEDTGIQRYLDRKGIIDEQDDDFGAPQLPGREALVAEVEDADSKESGEATPTLNVPRNEATSSLEMNTPSTGSSALHQHHITDYTCSRCNVGLKSGEALQSHQDWHFARDLQDQDERRELHGKKLPTNTGKRKAGQSSSRKTGGGSKSEKGQSKLSFG